MANIAPVVTGLQHGQLVERILAAGEAVWRPWATARGLDYQAGRQWPSVRWPRAFGTSEGVETTVEVLEHFGGFGTRVTCVPSAPVAVQIELTREGMLSSVAKLFGAQDIVLGDAPFDRAFLVKGSDVAAVKAMLTPALRAQLVELRTERVAYEGRTDPVALVELPIFADRALILDAVLRAALGLAAARAP